MRYLYIYMIKKNVSIKIESSHDQIAVTEEARGSRIVDETELEQKHRELYQRHIPSSIYDRAIRIPLSPGDIPESFSQWTE